MPVAGSQASPLPDLPEGRTAAAGRALQANMLPTLRDVAAPLLIAGVTTALVFGAGMVAGRSLAPDRPVPVAAAVDRCALPAGIDIAALDPIDRSFAMRRALLCADLEAGRIAPEEYRAGLAALDEVPPPAAEPVPDRLWAATVRAMSSQYGTSEWSAARALGAPDVETPGEDDDRAWASEGEDDRVEFLEVGFDRPERVSGVEILETYNPGAVTEVELIAADGTRTTVYEGAPASSSSFRRLIEVPCTGKPIAAVRVTIDSRAVPGWNEIDAIGVRPCR
jgi:hypothetical protein